MILLSKHDLNIDRGPLATLQFYISEQSQHSLSSWPIVTSVLKQDIFFLNLTNCL